MGCPPADTSTSPSWSPAVAAGLPGATAVIGRPPASRQSCMRSDPATVSPTHARRIVPDCWSSRAMRTARSMGMANPMPTDPPLWEKIELLTPTTSPTAFTSGPPLLPGLMAASVWIMPA